MNMVNLRDRILRRVIRWLAGHLTRQPRTVKIEAVRVTKDDAGHVFNVSVKIPNEGHFRQIYSGEALDGILIHHDILPPGIESSPPGERYADGVAEASPGTGPPTRDAYATVAEAGAFLEETLAVPPEYRAAMIEAAEFYASGLASGTQTVNALPLSLHELFQGMDRQTAGAAELSPVARLLLKDVVEEPPAPVEAPAFLAEILENHPGFFYDRFVPGPSTGPLDSPPDFDENWLGDGQMAVSLPDGSGWAIMTAAWRRRDELAEKAPAVPSWYRDAMREAAESYGPGTQTVNAAGETASISLDELTEALVKAKRQGDPVALEMSPLALEGFRRFLFESPVAAYHQDPPEGFCFGVFHGVPIFERVDWAGICWEFRIKEKTVLDGPSARDMRRLIHSMSDREDP